MSEIILSQKLANIFKKIFTLNSQQQISKNSKNFKKFLNSKNSKHFSNKIFPESCLRHKNILREFQTT